MSDDELSIQFATYAERNLDWPRRTIFRRSANALVAIGQALLAIHVELRRLNEGRDQWYREVLEVLTAAKDPDGSLRSAQPAAAPGCLICGSQASKFSCPKGAALTQAQWTAHRDEEINESVRHGADWTDAQRYADRETTERFGPCPEES